MTKVKLNHLVSAPHGKIIKEAQNSHGKKDTVFGRDIPKSKYILDLKHQARSEALEHKKK
jgi:hypothetical protein